MDIGRTKAEVELTKKLAATLVQTEVMEPMAAQGWRHGTPPSPEQTALIIADKARKDGATEEQIAGFLAERGVKYTPPAGGQPAPTVGAPAPVAKLAAPQSSGPPASPVQPAAPAPVAKTDTSDPNLEAARNLLNLMEGLKSSDGKYMGKYPSLAEALKGAGHLANMAKSTMAENDQLKQKLAAFPTHAGQAAPPAAVPAAAPAIKPYTPESRPALVEAQARLDKVLSKVNESGFDGDSAKEFAEATREVAREQALAVAAEQIAREKHAREVESKTWEAVNAHMAAKYPDSQHVNDDEFGAFLSLNPLLTSAMNALRVQGQEIAAAELGYTEFAKARGITPVAGMTHAEAERKEIDLAAREQVRKEARDEALKDAGIVRGSAGGSSAVETPGIIGPTQEDINGLAQAMRREGDAPGSAAAARWRHAVIGRFLPPELFGQ